MKINHEPLTNEENLTVLRRLKEKLSLPLVAVDSRTTGDKHTECNWGMCSCAPDVYTTELRTWPERELLRGGVYGTRRHGHCPFDKREKLGFNGCFWTCRVFQDGLSDPVEAVRLFELRIKQLEKKI